jgi:hypothetical protein
MQRSKPFSIISKGSYVPYTKEGIIGGFDFGLWQSHKVRRAALSLRIPCARSGCSLNLSVDPLRSRGVISLGVVPMRFSALLALFRELNAM